MQPLKHTDTRPPQDFEKNTTKEATAAILEELDELQNLLYAGRQYALLVVLQGMDASGKDGAIRKVFGHLNPQGVRVQSFKVPTEEEQSHDFLWRIHRHVPERGMIQVFNRSHYEDVLVTRVHGAIDDEEARKRFRAINDFERLLYHQGNTRILKFYLHISAEEQAARLEARKQDPKKMWKHNPGDEREAALRPKYLDMYEDLLQHCNEQPWQVVPADKNWYKEHLIAKAVRDTLRGLNMKYPPLNPDPR